ncbi:putative ribonuclease H-like domain-containing protein [Tanacetum coccineum]
MEAGTTSTTLTAKLPILNPGEYDLWLMRIEQYFLMTDYSLWESITSVPGVETIKVKTSESKPKSVSEPLIEDWIFDCEDENETMSNSKQRKSSFAKVEFVKSNEHVKSPRESIKKIEDKKQAKYPRKNSQSPRGNFVPRAVLMKSGLKTLNSARQNSSRAAISVNTARPINTACSRPTVNYARPASNVFNKAHSHVRMPFNKLTTNKNSNFNEKGNTVKGNVTTVRPKAVGNPQDELKLTLEKFQNSSKSLNNLLESQIQQNEKSRSDKGYHTVPPPYTWNFLPPKPDLMFIDEQVKRRTSFDTQSLRIGILMMKVRITHNRRSIRKKELLTSGDGTLDFDDVYFCKELKYNLFSVSQMCDKNNNVLFTDTEFLVLSSNFKLLDESQVLLRVPRKDNIYSVDLKSVVPTRVVAGNQTNGIAGTKDNIHSKEDGGMKPTEVDKRGASHNNGKDAQDTRSKSERIIQKERQSVHTNSFNIVSTARPSFDNAVLSPPVNTTRPSVSTANAFEEHLFERCSPFKNAFTLPQVPNVSSMDNTRIFGNAYDDEDVEEEVDMNNVVSSYSVPDTSFTKFHKDHPENQIEEEVYVCQPPGFEDPNFPDKVYKVEKALYGLHQALRACQDKYMAEILKKFDFAIVKTASTPMKPNKALIKDEEAEDVDVHLYRSMIGSLMYLTASRPDITFAQTIVANSTTEVEYVAAANCYGQVLWIQNQMLDYGFNFMNTKIYIGSESTICIVKNPVFHSKTKHIEIRHMTGNKSYLSDYEEIDGGFVAFGGSTKGGKITGKGRKPTLRFMRPFGCPVTILNTLDHLGKFDGKADEGYFIGYSVNSKAFRKPVLAGNQSNGSVGTKECDNTSKARVDIVPSKDYILLPLWTQNSISSSISKISPDAGFKPSGEEEKKDAEDARNEDNEMSNTEEPRLNQEKDENVNSTNNINTVSSPVNAASIEDNVVDENIVYRCADDPNMPNLEEIVYLDDDEVVSAEADMTNLDTHIPVSPILTTRIHKDHPVDQIIGDIHSAPQTKRMTKSMTEHGMFSSVQQGINHKDFQNCLFACFLSQAEPKKVIQALQDPSWIEAMQEELLQFKLQQVWTLVDLPYDKRAIDTKWVYRNKKDKRGIVIRNKARLVAQGYTQEEGINYDEVFALVARIEAIRLFLAYASFKDFFVYQMDVKSAFLYGKIEEEVYVYQPPGFEDPEFPDRVYKVKGNILLVQVYVDDIIFGSTKKGLCTEFEKLMHKKFQMSSMGELTFFLGLQVTQKYDVIFISQDKFVDEILKKFSFSTVKTASTPMETSKPLMKDENTEYVDVHLYRLMIGSLMYLTSSSPDIMFDVYACARFQVTPKVTHLHAVKRIFRYLKGQPKLGLWYPKDSPFDLEAYTDSDYAGASLVRKFTTRGCQFLRRRLISWQCKKQIVVANSTTEAEYVDASSCYGQVLWIQNQMLDYGYNFMNTKIFIENESTICIVKNPVFHSKTKYIEIRHHFIKDSYEKRLIKVIKIHTDHNVADLLTKAFDVSHFQYLTAIIGMLNL